MMNWRRTFLRRRWRRRSSKVKNAARSSRTMALIFTSPSSSTGRAKEVLKLSVTDGADSGAGCGAGPSSFLAIGAFVLMGRVGRLVSNTMLGSSVRVVVIRDVMRELLDRGA